ncbi:MAG: glycosidase, partial [Phycisphaerae bacterium]|nr:glycosidase [Phycisphaerae bacterium]
MKLTRYDKNPIVKPEDGPAWESACTTNPAAWYDGRTVHLLYRAGPDTDDHPIYLGHAESTNGFDFRRSSDKPVFGPSEDGFDAGCIEDPRIIKFDGAYFVTYAARMFRPGAYWRKTFALNGHNPPLPEEAPSVARWNYTRSGLALTPDFRTWYRMGPFTPASVDDRDAIIFPEKVGGRFVMIHRPATWTGPEYGCENPSIWISYCDDVLSWKDSAVLAQPAFDWECVKIGGSTPPIKTPKGWLTLYHGVDKNHVYRVGAFMLDLENPSRIIARTREPILEPEADYELNGLVPNVVFPCGNVVIGDRLFVYYGGADRVCCVATAPLEELVEHVLS